MGCLFLLLALTAYAAPDLRVGASLHAFDHLGGFSQQAEAAAACGVTVLYASGLGGDGYSGIPAPDVWDARLKACREYTTHAKQLGVPTVLGYLCASSIVGLDRFAANWTPEMKAEFHTTPDTWLQQDCDGKPLPSWYGGEYRPACMNNPDWRAYEKYMVRMQIETGHDGIFFDNPTVHEKGCYCPHCMEKFAAFLGAEGTVVPDHTVEAMRKLAMERGDDFKRLRCNAGRDFIAEMRAYAQTLNPGAVITANNSLNQSTVLFSQCHVYGYNIFEMSKTEDFVTIEDMGSQPRWMAGGKTAECGPTYAQLHAIIHGKPLVAVTVSDNDYHTPPNLVRLAMAEAAAHQAVYLLWPAWPEEQRPRMIAAVRPCTDWLRSHTDFLNAGQPRRDVLLYLPFRRWVKEKKCAVTELAAELTAANVQYEVVDEEAFSAKLAQSHVAVVESVQVLNAAEKDALNDFKAGGGTLVIGDEKHWQRALRKAIPHPSLTLKAPETVRGVVRDSDTATVAFLYNLHIERLSSFEDRVTPAENMTVTVHVPFKEIKAVRTSTADKGIPSGSVEYTAKEEDGGTRITVKIPRLDIAMMLIFEKGAA
jgi:hypothetical protein